MAKQFKPQFGWAPNPRAVNEILGELKNPLLGPASFAIRGTGKGKVSLLFQAVEKLIGKFNTRNQGIGDCVSMGGACSTDVLKAVQIVFGGKPGEWEGETATEALYALSRVEIGKGQLGYGDGSYGAWVAQAVRTYGTLVRKVYGNIDLSKYSAQRARDWGRPGYGLPDELEPTSREHLVRTVSLVSTYEEAIDSLTNGYPIIICSGQGFYQDQYGRVVLDNEGFAKPYGQWPHCMTLTASDDAYRRPGCLVQNSWGDSCTGPTRHSQPAGSFWCDADVINSILREQDSWAFSNFEGYPPRKLNWRVL